MSVEAIKYFASDHCLNIMRKLHLKLIYAAHLAKPKHFLRLVDLDSNMNALIHGYHRRRIFSRCSAVPHFHELDLAILRKLNWVCREFVGRPGRMPKDPV